MTTFFQQLNPYELLGFATTLGCVWLNAKENVWGWPLGIVASVVYIIVFWEARLYADTGLSGLYVGLGFYGWYAWLFGGEERSALPIVRTPRRYLPALVGVGAAGAAGLGYLMATYTNASAPYADAALAVASLLAQWMLARKYLENWLVWAVADVAYVGLYYYKDLYVTALLYALLAGVAARGYWQWRHNWRAATAALANRNNVGQNLHG